MNTVGFDPGGKSAFGWAVLSQSAVGPFLIASGTCSSAPDALSAAQAATPGIPIAFGTDAPLFWVQTGDRKADAFVRTMVCDAGGKSGTVGHVNSLRGACLVQGVLVTRLAADLWPTAAITEAHPKALLAVSQVARDFANRVAQQVSEHERDAAIAAFSALEFAMQSEGWHDLITAEQGSLFFPCGKRVAYWFPKTRS